MEEYLKKLEDIEKMSDTLVQYIAELKSAVETKGKFDIVQMSTLDFVHRSLKPVIGVDIDQPPVNSANPPSLFREGEFILICSQSVNIQVLRTLYHSLNY